MMIAYRHLELSGYAPTLFHAQHQLLAPLFETVPLLPYPPLDALEEALAPFERLLIQNDHSERAYHLFDLRKRGRLKGATFFLPSPSKKQKEGDCLFDPKRSFADNLAEQCHRLFATPLSKDNGLKLPTGRYRSHQKRILIHPTSKDPKRKSWSQEKFIQLADRLKKQGYQPVFCVAPDERADWEELQEIPLPHFSNLQEVATFLYESAFFIGNDSGIGHLASNLHIPTLTLVGNRKKAPLWRPDWTLGRVVTPPFSLPNWKGIGLPLRDIYWKETLSIKRVLHAFERLVDESSCPHC